MTWTKGFIITFAYTLAVWSPIIAQLYMDRIGKPIPENLPNIVTVCAFGAATALTVILLKLKPRSKNGGAKNPFT